MRQKVPHLLEIILSGQCCPDREVIRQGAGVCGFDGKGDGDRCLLWHRYDRTGSCGARKKSDRCGTEPSGGERCGGQCKAQRYPECRLLSE